MPGTWRPVASQPAFNASTMLLLTDGTVLAAENSGPPNAEKYLISAGSPAMKIYTPVGEPDDEWRPRITGHRRDLEPGHSYEIHGERFNGMTQAVAYGDGATMATSYPLVRLASEDGHVHYCRTSGHSTMAVATRRRPGHTRFTVPDSLPHGRYDLPVVANGIASPGVEVRVG